MFISFNLAIIFLHRNVAVSGFVPAVIHHHIPTSKFSRHIPCTIGRRLKHVRVWYKTEKHTNAIATSMNVTAVEEVTESESAAIPIVVNTIVSPVLRLVYPDLMHYIEEYGHPNVPLGSEAGRQCATLRRLRVQEKLVDSDIATLDSINFIWHSLEDVYTQQKDYFDDFIQRLRKYTAENEGDISPPKKYKKDPELGAWVTALRRLHTVQEVDAEHVLRLDELGFQWNSPRKCGSKFMQQYRTILERIEAVPDADDEAARQCILNEPEITSWIQAQQNANLSETRRHYMTLIAGDEWTNFGKTI